MEGQLKVSDIDTFAKQAASAHKIDFAEAQVLAKSFGKRIKTNMTLRTRPWLPRNARCYRDAANGTDATKVTVFPGYTSQVQLQQAIDKAKG